MEEKIVKIKNPATIFWLENLLTKLNLNKCQKFKIFLSINSYKNVERQSVKFPLEFCSMRKNPVI